MVANSFFTAWNIESSKPVFFVGSYSKQLGETRGDMALIHSF